MTRRAQQEALAMFAEDGQESRRLATKRPRTNYTANNRALLVAGRHPATRTRVRPDLGKCGDCAFHVVAGYTSRIYHKCEQHRLGLSSSEASDIRVSWPACELFKPTG